MTTMQRMKNDLATIDKRDLVDRTRQDNRDKNDELTAKNRSKADMVLDKSRVRNDEATANRRETKDGSPGIALAIFSLMLLSFGFGAFFI